MRRPSAILNSGAVALPLLLGCWSTGDATTVRQLGFNEICNRATAVVEATVVDIEVISNHPDPQPPEPPSESPQTVAPASPAETTASAGDVIPAPPPAGLPTEGGRMLFSRVTLRVDRVIAGAAEPTITLTLAGGADDFQRVVVHGMPEFGIAKRYLLFLRQGFESAADPIVGVNQGYFEIASDATQAGDALLNMDGDILIAIEEDRFVVRANSRRAAGPTPQLGPVPVPTSPDQPPSRISPEVERYWLSEEPAMTITQLSDAVREARGEL